MGAAPGALIGAKFGAVVGWRVGNAVEAGKAEAGLALLELEKIPGVDKDTARAGAWVVGAVNGTLETVGAESVLKATGFAKMITRDALKAALKNESKRAIVVGVLKKIVAAGVEEGTTEYLQELTNIITEGEVAKPDAAFADRFAIAWKAVKENHGRALDAGLKGAQGGIGMAGAGNIISIRKQLQGAQAAKDRVTFFEELGKQAKDSTTRDRLPSEFRTFVDKLTKKYGAIDTVNVPADKLIRLLQSSELSIDDVREKMPEVAKALDDATRISSETGFEVAEEVAVPLKDFATFIAPLDGFDKIKNDIRLGDEPTGNEAAQIEKDAQKLMEVMKKDDLQASMLPDDSRSIFNDVTSKLTAIGQSEDVARKYAALWTAFAETRAKRLGVSALEYYKGLNLEISHTDLVEAIAPEEKISTLSANQLLLREKALKGDTAAMDALEESLSRDELTGANSQNAWKRLLAQNREGFYLSIDANDLKRVNDTIGHPEGDAFLQHVAKFTGGPVREHGGKFFRSGQGDEFTAFWPKTMEPQARAAVVALTKAMNEAPDLFGGKHRASISLGFGRSFKQADVAGGKAKERARAAGRSGFGRPEFKGVKVDLSQGDVFAELDESPAPTSLKQPAFHGTPHRGITAFSLGKMGTGEGAQAYGWGLYFAEKKAIAEDYRRKLSGSMIYLDGKLPETPEEKAVVTLLRTAGFGNTSPLGFKAAKEKVRKILDETLKEAERQAGLFDEKRREHYARLQAERDADVVSVKKQIEILETTRHAAVADAYAMPLEETVALIKERAKQRIDEIKNSDAWKRDERYADAYDAWLLAKERDDQAEMARQKQIMAENDATGPDDTGPAMSRLIDRLEVLAGMNTQRGMDGTAYVADFFDLTQLISRGGETSFGESIRNFGKDTGIHTDDLVTPPAGQVYEVDLPEKEELLDYDAPFNEQPEKVKEILRSKILPMVDKPGLNAPVRRALDGFINGEGEGQTVYRRLAKELGGDEAASKALLEAGIPGLKYLDGTSRKNGEGTHNFVIWSEQAIKIMRTYYQAGGKGAQNYRGELTFDDTREWFKMTLTGKANLSTILHETGHAFLEILRRDARAGDAASAQDLAIAEKWMAEAGADRTAQLERFARGFETYLMEGKAPSTALAEVFAAVKAWLFYIYRTLTRLDAPLTDEVRGVMDRMIATDDEISAARQATGLFPVAMPDMAPAEAAAFKDRYEKAVEARKAEMERDAVGALRRAMKDAETTLRAEVEAEAKKRKDFNAYEFLRTGKPLDGTFAPEIQGKKLSKQTIGEYLEDGDRRRVKLASLISEDGLDADAIAPYLGFDGAMAGQDLVNALLDMPSRAAWIKEETNRRMLDKYPDADVASLAQKAMETVHSPEIDTVLEEELDAFDRKAGAAPTPRARDVLRMAARKRVEEMSAQEMQPGNHLRAEEGYAKEVLAAVANKDYAKAREARRRQMYHRFLWRETTRAKEEIAKVRDYIASFEELPVRKRIGKAGEDYLNAIDAIIDGIDLMKRSNKELARRASLDSYLQAMEDRGEPVAVNPELRAELGTKNYRQMTLTEIQAVRDAVKNIETIAKLKNKLRIGKEVREFKGTVVKVAEHVRANVGVNFKDGIGEPSWWAKKKEFLRKARANMSKIEFITRVLDGGKTAGWAHEVLFQPFVDAQAKKWAMSAEITEVLLKPFRAMSHADRVRFDKTHDFLGHKLKFREIVALMLNLGNEGNKEKLLKGFKFTEGQVMDTLNEMHRKGSITDADLDLVQHVWDTIGKLWPEIRELTQRNVGLAPDAVAPSPLLIGGRTLRGGYYPVVYNRRLSHKAEQISERKTGDLFENSFLLPAVEKGFTQTRTKFYAPVSLSLDVIPSHIEEVIHYVTHYEAVRNADRILASKEVKEAITEGLGREVYGLFRPWLQAIAADGVVHESTKWYDAIFRHLRLGSSIAILAFKVTTGLKQTFGLATTAKEIGRYTVTGGRIFAQKLFSGKNPFAEVREFSPEFENIDLSHDRDMAAMFRKLSSGAFSGYGQMKENLAHFGLAWMMLNQKMVNAITWYGAREKALREDHPNPRAYADSIVRLTQSGGGIKDLAAIQRGSETEKMFTVMYTYFSVMFNQLTEAMPSKKTSTKVAIMAARWWWLVTLPVFLDTLAGTGVPDDDEDKEKWKEALLTAQLTYASRTVPVGGDALSAFLSDREVRYGAWWATLLRGAKAAGDIAQGEGTPGDVRDATDLLGAAGHLPVNAARNAMRYLEEIQNGTMEEPIKNLLFRNPSEWK